MNAETGHNKPIKGIQSKMSDKWQKGKIKESGYYWITFCNELIIVEIDINEQNIYFMGDEGSSSDLNIYEIEKWIKIEKPPPDWCPL